MNQYNNQPAKPAYIPTPEEIEKATAELKAKKLEHKRKVGIAGSTRPAIREYEGRLSSGGFEWRVTR